MKPQILIYLLLLGLSSSAQSIDDLSFGTDATFEVMTWNIEHFPKNGQVTVNFVIDIIEALDVDLLAIQEVDNVNDFGQMMDGLDSYNGYLESAFFAGLAYIYKPDVIQINDIYEIYTTSEFWSPFPRSPMVIDLNFKGERIIVINNHFKCCGDGFFDSGDSGDEETRRYIASNLLKSYVDTNFPNENIIVLGDLNDSLSDNAQNNVFQLILNDDENYVFTDFDIATGSNFNWSFPTWPSHLDHILITNELFDEFEDASSVIQTIKIDDYLTGGWTEYDTNISDHRPVALKLLMEPILNITDSHVTKTHFINYPNPFNSETRFSFKAGTGGKELKIINILGQTVFSKKIQNGDTSIVWNAEGTPDGMYLARLLFDTNEFVMLKLILKK